MTPSPLPQQSLVRLLESRIVAFEPEYVDDERQIRVAFALVLVTDSAQNASVVGLALGESQRIVVDDPFALEHLQAATQPSHCQPCPRSSVGGGGSAYRTSMTTG